MAKCGAKWIKIWVMLTLVNFDLVVFNVIWGNSMHLLQNWYDETVL